MIKQLRKLLGILFYDLHEPLEKPLVLEECLKFRCSDYDAQGEQVLINSLNQFNRTITRHWTLKNPFNDKKIVILKQKIQ